MIWNTVITTSHKFINQNIISSVIECIYLVSQVGVFNVAQSVFHNKWLDANSNKLYWSTWYYKGKNETKSAFWSPPYDIKMQLFVYLLIWDNYIYKSNFPLQHAEFDWNKTLRSSMLASFFYGYIITQIPGGWLADRFGGKRVFGIAMAISGISNVLLPVCARLSYLSVFVLRVITGLATVSCF